MAIKRTLRERYALSERLQLVTNIRDLLLVARSEIERATGYRHAWLYLLTPDRSSFELIEVAGEGQTEELFAQHCLILPVQGDAMLEQIAGGKQPVVVVDARSDPRTNPEIVRALGCITLINVPIRLIDYPLGGLGTGTFADEGVRAPSRSQVRLLADIADQVALALARIQNQEQALAAQREQHKLLDHLSALKRQETFSSLISSALGEIQQRLDRVVACADVLSHEPLSAGAAAAQKQLQQSLERLTGLVRPLSRLTHRPPLQDLAVDINARLEQITSGLVPLLPGDVLVEKDLQPDLEPVLGDAFALDQVLLTMLLCAKQGLRAGGLIRVATHMKGHRIQVEVAPRGPLPAESPCCETLEAALCLHIIAQHHGKMDISSDGHFRLNLPGYHRPRTRAG